MADYFGKVAMHRRALADALDELNDEQWATQSWCDQWSVRQLAGHLTLGWSVSTPKFAWAMLRSKGNFNAANVALSNKLAEQPTSELVADLRRNADHRFTPPGGDSRAPLSDLIIHSQDMFRPLGIDHEIPVDSILPIADLAVDAKTRRIRGTDVEGRVTMRATDCDWTNVVDGAPEVEGRLIDLMMVVFGRSQAVGSLSGDVDAI